MDKALSPSLHNQVDHKELLYNSSGKQLIINLLILLTNC